MILCAFLIDNLLSLDTLGMISIHKLRLNN